MASRRHFLPSYRLHKQSGQAVVTLPDGHGGRHDVLLGTYATQASRVRYAEVIEEWEAAGRRFAYSADKVEITINDLILAFWKHAEQYYRHADGTPTSELAEYRYSLKPVRAIYGHSRASQFGPLALKAVRQRMIDAGLCRSLINRRVGRIRRVFKWAVAEELVPSAILQSLQAVAGLARGRTKARESRPVQPVPDAFVRAVLPHVLPPVAAMIELQMLTGARPGELCGTLDARTQLERAIAKAKRDNSRVLVMFGFEGCSWCHKLHALFRENVDIRKLLYNEYVLVMVDTESPHAGDLIKECKAALPKDELEKGVG